MKLGFFTILAVCSLLMGCPGFKPPTQAVVITGDIPRDAFLYKVPDPQQPDPDSFEPIKRVFVGSSIELPAGHYYLANECSGYAFEHKSGMPTKVVMSKIALIRKAQGDAPEDPDEPLLLECTDPVDGTISRWQNRSAVAVFPGEATIMLTKKPFTVTSPSDTPQTHNITLTSVLLDGGPQAPKDRYFVIPELTSGNADPFVVSASAGKRIWLPAGIFTLEVNGTRRKYEVNPDTENVLPVGTLRIDVPETFSPETRARAGGQPVFAFINDGVLFNLATDYLLLPGEYDVSIEGSDVRKHIIIEPGKKTVVSTRVAQINPAPCPTNATCRGVPRITIHKEQRPFPLMYVDPGVPFVVFDEPYEYAVDGTRGVYRTLPTSNGAIKTEKLARVKIKWEVRPASGKVRTDLVRVESRGAPNFGRSLDLLFSKPDEISVPAGNYALTYFVGDPAVDRVKTRTELIATEGSTQTVVVPLYMESKQKHEALEAERKRAQEAESGKIPASLTPIQR